MKANKKPVIGISAAPVDDVSPHWGKIVSHRVASTYVNAIVKAGGIPVLIPAVGGGVEEDTKEVAEEIVRRFDGIVLSGGGDIRPTRYGETETHETVSNVNDERDEFEIAISKAAIEADRPLLGVCRGCQVLNVACGGTLWQDVPTMRTATAGKQAAEHWQRGRASHESAHGVMTSGILQEIYHGAERIGVNSFHHQGIREVGRGLEVTGVADDGLVESIADTHRSFIVGIQWHPEAMCDKVEIHEAPFRALAFAAIKVMNYQH